MGRYLETQGGLTGFMERAAGPVALLAPETGRVLYCNPPFEEMFGINPGESRDAALGGFLGPENSVRAYAALAPLLAGRAQTAALALDLSLPFKRTVRAELSFTLVQGAEGEAMTWLVVRELPPGTASTSTFDWPGGFARLLDGTPVAVIVTDGGGLILKVNPSACALLSYSSQELTGGFSIQSVYEGDADRELFGVLLSAESSGNSPRIVNRGAICITKDRRRVQTRLNAHLFEDAAGNRLVAHLLSAVEDVSDMEQRLEEAQLQLIHADKMASLGKLAAGVAHEMNNPLGGILLFGGLLLEDLEPDDPRHQHVARILQEARRCSETVSSLLDFAHQRKRYQEEVDLGAAVDHCMALLGGKSLFHNIEVVTDYQVGIGTVVGNPSQIKQVFTNIITNAVDAMNGEGRLSISVFEKPDSGEVCVAFRDSGPGIPASAIGRVFDPFFTTKEPGKGTGLGLSLSYNIIRMHKGDIRACNLPEGGAQFTVVFPRGKEPKR